MFALHSYKSLVVKLLVAAGADILLLSILIIWIDATPDLSIIEIAIIPSLIIINICLAIVARFAIRKLYLTFLFNIVIAPLIFYGLFIGWFWYQDHQNFNRWQFRTNGKNYELLLDKRDTSYSISERYTGSSIQFMRGQYRVGHDSIHLIDIVNPMVIFRDSLVGFEKEKIPLVKQ